MHWNFMRRSSQSRRPSNAPRKTISKLNLEELEDRQLLTVTSSIFTVDPASSVITLSGDVSGSTILPQATGSLTTNFGGSIVAAWDLDGQTISFLQAGTSLNAANSGSWKPLPGGGSGSAPANYGGMVSIVIFTANIALRNLVVSGFTDNPLPLSGTGPYSFPSTQTLTVTAGTADYNAGILGTGTTDLSGLFNANQSPVAGTFEDLGNGAYRVTEPINLTVQRPVGSFQVTLHIDGQIVANTALPLINLSDGTGSSFNYATTAVAGSGPVATEDPAAAVIYVPAGNLSSLTVTLLNHPDDTAEFLGFDLGSSGLSTNGYDPTTGQLVITGSAPASVYQDLLRTITYENDSLAPDTSDRLIQFVASDGVNTSVVRTTTVSVSPPPSPSPPPGFADFKPPFSSDRTPAVPGDLHRLDGLFSYAPTLQGLLALSTRPPAEDLATTLFTISRNSLAGPENAVSPVWDTEFSIPLDRRLAPEALATDLGLLLT